MALPKFDMPSHESSMSANDVKSLALRHGIPLDLHPVALTKGWTMDKLSDDMKACAIRIEPINYVRVILSESKYCPLREFVSGWKKRFFMRAILDVMAWRHHDSDINDPISEDGFSAQDMETLAERVIDLRPIPFGLLFQGGLATTWDFTGFLTIFKDTEGNVVAMYEYLHFSFLSGATIEKESATTNQDLRVHHTVPLLLAGQAIQDKTDHQKEVEIADPKIVARRERKVRAAAKKKDKKKRGTNEEEGSPNHFVHEDQTKRNLTIVPTELLQTSSDDHFMHCSLTDDRTTSPARFSTQAQEESNALNNSTALERAWFTLGRGVLAQADMLERFENLQADYDSLAETHADCGDTIRCTEQVQLLEGQNSKLSQVNKDQALKIKEIEDTLARKDSALVYAERINAERVQEKERFVAQLSKSEMEKFNCIRKLLPTLHVEYEKLFEKWYLYVEKISRGFRHTVSDLLKVYPDSPPSGQAPPSKPSSGKAPSSAPEKT
nr:hypothetical protein [Tanacetum cinerariifolium]